MSIFQTYTLQITMMQKNRTFLILFLAIFMISHTLNGQNRMADSLALVAIYDSCGGENWRTQPDFNEPLDNWDLISFRDGRVTSLRLRYNRVSNTFPEQVANLDQVTYIDLDFNEMENPFKNIHLFTKLRIIDVNSSDVPLMIHSDIAMSQSLEEVKVQSGEIMGDIPAELAMIPTIETIDFSENNYAGSIPTEYAPSIRNIDFSENDLELDISNLFAGNINLRNVDLSDNKLTGNFPIQLLNSQLSYLDLSNNQLEGPLPTNIGDLTELSDLILKNNNFSGPLPESFNSLSRLKHIIIGGNSFSGEINLDAGVFNGCSVVDLSRNNFAGNIPASLGTMKGSSLGALLDLSENNFEGGIPASLTEINNLKALDLSGNNLTGQLDSSFTNKMTDLSLLDVSDNALQGALPTIISENLRSFNVANNQFAGVFDITGLPNIRSENWAGVNLTGTSYRSHLYNISAETAFCPGNQMDSILYDPEINTRFTLSDYDTTCVQNLLTSIHPFKADQEVRFYPNPTSSEVFFTNLAIAQIVSVIDMQGKTIAISRLNNQSIVFQQSGMYKVLYLVKDKITAQTIIVL